MADIRISDLEWNHIDGKFLRQAQRIELAQRYGTDDSEPGSAPTTADITVFIVAYIDKQPVGCGALRQLHANASTGLSYPGDAEVKRMFVLPERRGKGSGVASAILQALEESARARGWTILVLETGKLQPDAIRFYMREGYTPIANFGAYAGVENSLCFEKRI